MGGGEGCAEVSVCLQKTNLHGRGVHNEMVTETGRG